MEAVVVKLGNYSIDLKTKNNLSAADCGKFRDSYIVGGHEASEGSHPWTAALFYKFRGFLASAVIINDWWLLTAAHVFEDLGARPHNYYVRVGTNDRTVGTDYQIAAIVVNDRYDNCKYREWDIALIKVKDRIRMGEKVRPICLPQLSYQSPEGTVTVTGWGRTQYQGYTPNKLQQVELRVIPIEQCAAKYSQLDPPMRVFKSQLCTWTLNKDACQGDSGGPAIQIEHGKAILVGIVSYGVTCADQYPGVFTKVSYFINWIQTKLAHN